MPLPFKERMAISSHFFFQSFPYTRFRFTPAKFRILKCSGFM